MKKVRPIYTSTYPLCFLPSGKLVCSRKDRIITYDTDFTECKNIDVSRIVNSIRNNRLLQRFFRSGVRATTPIDEKTIALSVGHHIYELDLANGDISSGFDCGNGKRPLMYAESKGIDSIKDGIYWGEYFRNPNRKEVKIYHRLNKDAWEVAYTFQEGEINHIHSIVPDPYRQCLWIFTGDFEHSSAIWKVTDNFRKVECIRKGHQKYRACVGFALPEGLLYASDSPIVDNAIYLMETDRYEIKTVKPIDGSCIYGCRWRDRYVFSTTVESDGLETNLIQALLNRKRGPAIKDDFVHLYSGNLEIGFDEIYKERKDKYPFAFQFGAFHFPAGINNSDVLCFSPIATVLNEYSLLSLEY